MNENNSTTTKHSTSETEEVQRAICTEKCRENLEKWIRRKFWVVPTCIGVMAFFGVNIFIDWTVEKQMDKKVNWVDDKIRSMTSAALKAEFLADEAKDAAIEADKSVREYTKTLSEIQQRIKTAQDELTALDQKIATVANEYLNLTGETGHVRDLVAQDVDNLKIALTGLEEFVRRLAKETTEASSEALLVAYEAEVKKAEDTAEKEKETFQDNAKYRIRVFFTEKTSSLSDKVSDKLSKSGFKVSSFDISRAQELLLPIQSQSPRSFVRTGNTLASLKDNLITYTRGVERSKVDQVCDSLASADGVVNLTVLTKDFFVRQYGDPFLAQVSPSEFFKTNLIEIYLVNID